LLKIGELARRLGLTTRSLRYWEERGLLPAPRRTAGGMRMYGPEHVVAARGILRLKRAGFTLERIEAIREHVRGSDTALAGMVSLSGSLADQENRLRESIAELQAMLQELTAARQCMDLCDGCHGKAFDAECIDCLGEASHHAMPDCLSSVLQAACSPIQKTKT
jgi:DNA-binding transcriptional MerR regulator